MRKLLGQAAMFLLFSGFLVPAKSHEITVVGSQEENVALHNADRWWAKRSRTQPLEVPHRLVLVITERWKKNALDMPVPLKKEIFYTSLLPLVLHANELVLDRRNKLMDLDARLVKSEDLSNEEITSLQNTAVLLRIVSPDDALTMTETNQLRELIKECLYRLDVIPPGLVLGQAAYESGYATSRFAVKGQALFGQWSFGGEGLVPEQQREKLGDHRIASFEWPFDSVRSYFLNLSSHPAYEEFRRIRSDIKKSKKPLNSIALADGLINYSERGQEYVDNLKAIITQNDLDIADNAVFRDEPVSYLLSAEDKNAAEQLRKDLDSMRETGELTTVIARMRLE